VIDEPDDYIFEANDTVNMSWTLADNMSSWGYYNVLIEGEDYVSGTWTNNTPINVTVDTNRGVGNFNYTLLFNDTVHSDSDYWGVLIEDTTAPRVNHVFLDAHVDGNNWVLYNDTVITCVPEANDIWDVDYYEFYYTLDDNIFQAVPNCYNVEPEDDDLGYCNWTIPRETSPLNISCRAVDMWNNIGDLVNNTYAGVDLEDPTVQLLPITPYINTENFNLSVLSIDYYEVANVTYMYYNGSGYGIGTNNTNPFNFTWNVPISLENKYINISATAKDYASRWDIDYLYNVGVNAINEVPLPDLEIPVLLPGFADDVLLLDATNSNDFDFVIDNVYLYYNYQISNDNNKFYNITGCEDINTTCSWSTNLTYSVCDNNADCYIRAQVYDNENLVNSSVYTHYIDNVNPSIDLLNPSYPHVMHGSNQMLTCTASDAGTISRLTLEVYYNNGTEFQWELLEDSTNDAIIYDWDLTGKLNHNETVSIRCNATDSNNNNNSLTNTQLSISIDGPEFQAHNMNVSSGTILGQNEIVRYSQEVTDASPGVDQVYFNTSIGEFRGLKGIGNTYYFDQSCGESGTIYW
jgi:hypothetical protein